MSSSKNPSVSTLNSPYVTSRNNELCSLQNQIHDNTRHSDLYKTQTRAVHRAIDVMKKQVKVLYHKTWHSTILEYLLKYKAMK